jgi:hypothetical protein
MAHPQSIQKLLELKRIAVAWKYYRGIEGIREGKVKLLTRV